MANHKNDHSHESVVTVAVRQEVERAIAASVPVDKRQELVQRVEQIVDRYSSPYPDAAYLEKIERLAPGATRDIINASVEDLKHRRRMDERQADLHASEIELVHDLAAAETSSVGQGRWIGFSAYIACLLFSGTMYALGSEKLAFAGFGTAALGIIVQLIRGGGGNAVKISTEVTTTDPPAGGKTSAKSSKG